MVDAVLEKLLQGLARLCRLIAAYFPVFWIVGFVPFFLIPHVPCWMIRTYGIIGILAIAFWGLFKMVRKKEEKNSH